MIIGFLLFDQPEYTTTVGPACVAAVAAVIIALINRRSGKKTSAAAAEAASEARAAREDLSIKIGIPNGKGNVVQMNEEQLLILKKAQADRAARDDVYDRHFQSIEDRMNLTGQFLARLDTKFDNLLELITREKP